MPTQSKSVSVPNWVNRTVWTGDNLPIMRGMNSETVDLIYLDPPFNSNADYAAPIGSEAAGAEFKDTWTLQDVDVAWVDLIDAKHPAVAAAIAAAMTKSDKSYLIYMAPRLMEMRRLLKPTGTVYLHCDPTMSHYLKILMDAVFGRGNFRNEVIWHYGKMSNAKDNFPKNHDILLRYTKSSDFTFNPIAGGDSEYRNRYIDFLTDNRVLYGSVKHKSDLLISRRIKKVKKKLGKDELDDSDVLFDFNIEFKMQSDVIYVPIIKGNSKERLGYPTQKPVALLMKLLEASSNPGEIVFDPFCGCASTLVAAEGLKWQREWAGIDLSPLAVRLVVDRLWDDYQFFGQVIDRIDIPQRDDLGRLPKYNSPANKSKLYGEQSGNCNGCDFHFQKHNLEVDHIIAVSKGGTDHIDNLQLLCSRCNRVKGDRGQDWLKARLSRV